VIASNDRAYETDLLDALSQRVLVGDGAIRELSLKGTAIAERVGVDQAARWVSKRRSGDDVDFPGREALQRFRVPAGIRHARQS
jgi:hypothetical protein